MNEAIEIFTVFLGLSSLFTLPLTMAIGLPLIGWNVRAWIRLKEKELELRRLETATRIRQLSLDRVPEWVDAGDPEALLAWARTDKEMRLLQ